MKRIICLCIVSLITFGCSSFDVKKTAQFSEEESGLLSKQLQAVGFDFSYDYEMCVWGIFNTAAPDLKITDARKADDEKKIAEALASADQKTVIALYEKTYKNYYSILYLKKYYEKKKDWKYYTVLTKTFLPSMEYYLYQSEQIFSKKMPDVKTILDGRKAALNGAAVSSVIERLAVVDGFN